jgi:NAD-dependent SIR2 family protein deacetylase
VASSAIAAADAAAAVTHLDNVALANQAVPCREVHVHESLGRYVLHAHGNLKKMHCNDEQEQWGKKGTKN